MSDIDLTIAVTSETNVDGLIFTNVITPGSVGSGQINSFLSIQEHGQGDGIESGYNTDGTPLPLDDTRPTFTNALPLSDLGVITVDGTDYYRFFLDIGEDQGHENELLSLSALKFYMTGSPNQTGSTVTGDLVYELPEDVLMDSSLTSGSGNGFDVAVYVPISLFDEYFTNGGTGTNLILFAEFGGPDGNGGDYGAGGVFEEWAFSSEDEVIITPRPEITIDKVTSSGDLAGSDSNIFLVGTGITWTYTITNTGNVSLTDIVVSDDEQGTVSVLVSNGNGDDIFDVGEVWVFTMSGVATANAYTNLGTVHGNYGDEDVTASDLSGYFGADPKISIEKVTSAGVLEGRDDYTFLVGTAITWTYTITNEGNVALTDIFLTDDQIADIMDGATIVESGIDNDILDVGETWVFTYNGTAEANAYSNLGTVTGNYGDTEVTDDDPSGYFGANPIINIDKVTVDGDVSGDGLVILAGEDISWLYTVTNGGNVALSDISVSDSEGVTVVYESGDVGGDGILGLGETWIYAAIGTAIVGSYSNTGTASGSFTDSTGTKGTDTETNDSNYFGAAPSISLVKDTQGTDTTGTSHTGDGIVIQAGTNVTWIYTLDNDGNVALNFDKFTGLVDDGGPGADFNPVYFSGDVGNDGILGVDETWVFKATGLATPGGYANSATASTTFTDDAGHVATPHDTDTSSYTGVFVEDGRARTQGFWQSVSDAWDNVGGQANSTLAKFNSGELRDLGGDTILDVNPTAGQFLLLGDANGNGVTDTGECTLKIDLVTARNLLASSTTGDARLIMMAQTIAAQLNIDNGVKQPDNLIKEAVQWLTNKGSWAGLGVNIDADNNGVVDTSAGKLLGTAVATSSGAWQTYKDVTQQDATLNFFANGEGLKNALMWFNDGHLVTSLPNGTFVGWDGDGRGGSTTVAAWQFNNPDNFWLTLHQVDTSIVGLTGIA